MRRQFVIQTDARTLLFAADFHNAAPVVVVQIQTVAVTVAQHFQPLALRVVRVSLKQKTLPVIAADKPVPCSPRLTASPSPGCKPTSRQYGFHIRGVAPCPTQRSCSFRLRYPVCARG